LATFLDSTAEPHSAMGRVLPNGRRIMAMAQSGLQAAKTTRTVGPPERFSFPGECARWSRGSKKRRTRPSLAKGAKMIPRGHGKTGTYRTEMYRLYASARSCSSIAVRHIQGDEQDRRLTARQHWRFSLILPRLSFPKFDDSQQREKFLQSERDRMALAVRDEGDDDGIDR